MGATEKMRDISHQVRAAADEQAATSKHISGAIEVSLRQEPADFKGNL